MMPATGLRRSRLDLEVSVPGLGRVLLASCEGDRCNLQSKRPPQEEEEGRRRRSFICEEEKLSVLKEPSFVLL
jgi:hypothetical protein